MANCMYYVKEGEVYMEGSASWSKGQTLRDGSVFGELVLIFFLIPRSMPTANAEGTTSMLKVPNGTSRRDLAR